MKGSLTKDSEVGFSEVGDFKNQSRKILQNNAVLSF
jgi:hypothetical protein